MNTTTSTKPTDAGTLPKRDPKTGQFEKATTKAATTTKPAAPKATTTTKPVAPKTTTTTKPAAPKATTTTKPVAPTGKKP